MDHEKTKDRIQELATELMELLGPRSLGSSRELSLARTKLEEMLMWVEQGLRPGK